MHRPSIGPYSIGYMKAGGIVYDNFAGLSVDEFDLDHGMASLLTLLGDDLTSKAPLF